MATTMILLLTITFSAKGQVFIMGEESSSDRAGTDASGVNTIIPIHNVEFDQENEYVPLGGGTLVLAGLGLCYLLKKNKKE